MCKIIQYQSKIYVCITASSSQCVKLYSINQIYMCKIIQYQLKIHVCITASSSQCVKLYSINQKYKCVSQYHHYACVLAHLLTGGRRASRSSLEVVELQGRHWRSLGFKIITGGR